MLMKRRLLLGALAGLFCLAAAGTVVGDAETGAAKPPIKVGVTVSLTGQYDEFGREQFHGMRMWVDDINIRGGLIGRKVELVYYDDKSDSATSAQLYERLIGEDRVDLLLGPYSSELTIAASRVAERHGIPMVTTGASASEIWSRGLRNVFSVDVPARRYMDPALQFAKQKGLRRVAVMHADTAFAREVIEGVRAQARTYGLEIVFEETYPQSRKDFSGLVQRMQRANPEVVMGGTYFDDAVGFVRAMRAYQLRPEAVILTVGPALKDFGEALGPAAKGIMGVIQWMPSGRLAMARDFTQRYVERYGYAALVHAALGYGAGQVLEAGVRLAGTTETNAVRRQLRELRFRSVLGRYRVDDTGKQLDKKMFMMQWQSGHRNLVWPVVIAENEVIYPLMH
jgi:branched-chain amino acid transport system substrate-binding protein